MDSLAIIVQARMNSTRLPKKIALKLGTTTILEYLINRLKTTKVGKNLVIATTTSKCDDEIIELCRGHDVKIFRGSENDVYLRFKGACDLYGYKSVIRICSDCPFIDTSLIDKMSNLFLSMNCDILSSLGGPLGVGKYISIFNMDKLSSFEADFTAQDREHVTKYFYDNPDKINLGYYLQDKKWKDDPIFDHLFYDIRVNLDTIEDYKLITAIYDLAQKRNVEINRNFIIEMFVHNSDLFKINNTKSKDKEFEYCLRYLSTIDAQNIIYESNEDEPR